MLTQVQVEQYQTDGYTIIEGFLPEESRATLRKQAAKIVNEHGIEGLGHIFSTGNNDRSGDDYFLSSAEKVRCFFEEDAFDSNGELVQDRSQCINKIGHALHELDPVFERASHLPALGGIASALGMSEPEIRQSMYIFKQPRIGGVVNWHQDATFFYTEPISVVTFWFAIEDATKENGCLWVEPGGHRGPLRERFNREGDVTTMKKLDNTPWPTESGVALEVKAGTLVCFHGLLPHYSAPNHSDKSRQAYVLHVTDATSRYAESNWLQARELTLRGFAR